MLVAVLVVVVTVVALVIFTLVQRQRGYSGLGGDTVVRCRAGHVFTTIWLPGASLKSVRLGMSRFQHCPVGHHWTLVTPVKDGELTDAERQFASAHHDVRIP
jgi:hypothetical protein